MGTGANFTIIHNKRILGHTDLDEWFLQYLRGSHLESVMARWDQDGVFNTKLTLAGGSVDRFRVIGSSLATDGYGHIINIVRDYPGGYYYFENSAAVDYEVGLGYAEIPQGVRINPRTGKPEYDHMMEYIGEAADPASVVDNGGGTITLNVNSITESGVDNSGRIAVVYLKSIDENALTAAVAIEELAVSYSGGNNTITTSGSLGQTIISTTASDYTVVLLGPSCKRNSSIQSMGGMVYIGTITGNGGDPVAFDETAQNLFKTFQDASQITFTPYLYLTATDVQTAIQQMVDALTATSGASRVGFDASALNKSAPPTAPADDIGLGNIADGTFTASSDLQDAIVRIDSILADRRSWTLSISNGGYRTEGDLSTTIALNLLTDAHTKYARGGTYWVQDAGPSGWYTLGSATVSGFEEENAPYVLGESYGETTGDATEVRLTAAGIAAHFDLRGRWQRMYFQSVNSTYSYLASGSASFEDCCVRAGDWIQDSTRDTKGAPFEYRRVLFATGGVPAQTFGMKITNEGTGTEAHGIIENCVFDCPQTIGTECVLIDGIGVNYLDGDNTPLTFRNCVFKLWDQNAYCLRIVDARQPIVFENCVFDSNGYGPATNPLVYVDSSRVTFRDCTFNALSQGQCLWMEYMYGEVENCLFYTGTAGGTATDPCIIYGMAPAEFTLRIRNCLVKANRCVHRSSGGAQALIELGGFGGTPAGGIVEVDGLEVDVSAAGGTGIHSYQIIELHGSVDGNVYRDISLDLNGWTALASTDPMVSAVAATGSHILVDGLRITGVVSPSSGYATGKYILGADEAHIRNVLVQGPASSNTGRYNRVFQSLGDNNLIDGFVIDSPSLDVDAEFFWIGNDDNTIRNVVFADHADSPTAGRFFYTSGSADRCRIDGVSFRDTWDGSKYGFQLTGLTGMVQDVTIQTTVSLTNPFFQSSVARNCVRNCNCSFGGTPQVLTFAGSNQLVFGNVFIGLAGTATITNSGANSIGDATDNLLA